MCTFRHALALDERRARFKANQYNVALKDEALLGITERNLAEKAAQTKKGKPLPHREASLRMLERKYSKDRDKPTNVEEVRA